MKQQNLHLVQVVWLLSLFSSFQPSWPTTANDGKCTTLHTVLSVKKLKS